MSGFRLWFYRRRLSAVFRRVRACVASGVVITVFTGIVAVVRTCVAVVRASVASSVGSAVCIVAVVCVIRFVFVVVIIVVVHNLNTILSQLECAE